MYINGTIAHEIFTYIKSQNNKKVDDPDQAILDFANKMESIIMNVIRQLDVDIPAGLIQVTTPSGPAFNISTKIPRALK